MKNSSHSTKTLWIALALPFAWIAGLAWADPPQHDEDKSPVDGLQQAIDHLKESGKDVSAVQAELDGLKPDWDTIHTKQLELMTLVKAFQPKMEALMHKVQKLGGGDGGTGESPIVGIQHALDMLRSKGKDVAALQVELDGLKPEFLAIQAAHGELEQSQTSEQKEKQKELEQKVKTFQPKVEALVKKVQEIASTVGASQAPDR